MTTAPAIWLRPIFGLMILPPSMTETTRLTRRRALAGSHVTSANCAPKQWVRKLWLCSAESAFALALAAYAALVGAGKHVAKEKTAFCWLTLQVNPTSGKHHIVRGFRPEARILRSRSCC